MLYLIAWEAALDLGLLTMLSSTLSHVFSTRCLLSAAQPNKVYVGGLPEHTRQEDLQSCFGKIGNITNIELKYVIHVCSISICLIILVYYLRVGYGFVVCWSVFFARDSVLNCLIGIRLSGSC